MKLFLGLCLLVFLCLEATIPSLQYKITNIFSNCKISTKKSQKKEDYPFGQSSFSIFRCIYHTTNITHHREALRKPAKSAASKEAPP